MRRLQITIMHVIRTVRLLRPVALLALLLV